MDQNFYIPRNNYAPGNPWGAAANAYGNELDRLGSLQQQGYQQMAQIPNTIYDRFMQGYQQKMAEQRQQQQFDADAAYRQQQLQMQTDRWKAQDQQARLRDNATVQGDLVKNYRPELRAQYKAQLQAINPDWDDSRLEKMLPQLTPETMKIGENAPVPMYPTDPKTLQNPAMADNFRGLNVIAEEDRVKKSEEANRLMAQIANQKDSTQKALEEQRAKHALELEILRGSNKDRNLQIQIDAGRFNKAGSPYDANDPNLQAAADAHAAAWVKGMPPPSGLLRDKVVGPMIQASLGKLVAGGGLQGVDLAKAQALYRASSASLTGMTKMTDNMTAFERTAEGNYRQFEDAISKLGNGSPVLNKPINAIGKDMLGDPNVSAAVAAGQSALTEYARIINNPNLVGELPVTTRQEIFSVFPGGKVENATLSQVQAVGRILKADAQRRLSSNSQQLGAISDRIGGNASPSPGGGGLKPGDIQKGYRFKGGNPSDPNSWERA